MKKSKSSVTTLRKSHSKKRPGVHSKSKSSKLKSSKRYMKKNRGQGK